ncbi:MAG: hypothetical protein WDW38_000190 [Sanguina aurantia]
MSGVHPGAGQERERAPVQAEAVTRKIATISELSIYLQASSLKLGVERSDLEVEAGAARQRVEDGVFPNEEAEKEWCRWAGWLARSF